MKRAIKKKSGLYEYLDRTKVLETGSDQDIASARKEYYKTYKAEWVRKHRLNTKRFTVVFTPQEASLILSTAKADKRSQTRFIKQSCLAYINKRYLAPDILALGMIHQQLAMNYTILKNLFDESIIPYQVGTTLIQQIAELEQTVLFQLQNPKSLEQWIIETVRESPRYKETLIGLLQKL